MLLASLFIVALMALLSRLSGNGFGKQIGAPWIPEALFSIPFGLAHAYAWHAFGAPAWVLLPAFVGATVISYAGMQSATWYFLRWRSHDNPNMTRSGTLKGLIDWLAGKFGYELGDEGYAWIAAGVKGFIIGLPVGGLPLAILWPLGYEAGSHLEKLSERLGIDDHAPKEALAGAGAGISILLFLSLIGFIVSLL